MKLLEENKAAIRGQLGRDVAANWRIVPELIFVPDTTLDYAEHIEELHKK